MRRRLFLGADGFAAIGGLFEALAGDRDLGVLALDLGLHGLKVALRDARISCRVEQRLHVSLVLVPVDFCTSCSRKSPSLHLFLPLATLGGLPQPVLDLGVGAVNPLDLLVHLIEILLAGLGICGGVEQRLHVLPVGLLGHVGDLGLDLRDLRAFLLLALGGNFERRRRGLVELLGLALAGARLSVAV